jgi:hypothetical protein
MQASPKFRIRNYPDRCVAGDMFRIVISSIMQRRRGLNSAIGGSYLSDGLQTTTFSQAGTA